MAGDQCGLEQNMSQRPPSATDCAFSPHRSAVVRDGCKAGEGGGLFTGDLAKFRHFCDQHSACYRPNSANRAQDSGGVRHAWIGGDGGFNLGFQVGDLHAKQGFQFTVHTLKRIASAILLARLCLGKKVLAQLDKLPAFCAQGSEKAQFFMWQLPPGIRAQIQKPGNQLCIDPVGLGPRSPTAGQSLDCLLKSDVVVKTLRQHRISALIFDG